jgi:S-formylglutathione hydrolase FrmB
MNLSLLGQNLSLLICAIVTGLFVFLAFRIYQQKPDETKKSKKTKKKSVFKKFSENKLGLLLVSLIVGVILAFFTKAFFAHYTGSSIVVGIAFMIVPAMFSLVALVVFWNNFSGLTLRFCSFGFVIFCFIFSLLLINNYYRYYPTLGSVFNVNHATALKNSPGQVILSYTSPTNRGALNNTSVEHFLTSIGQTPTQGNVYSLNIPGTVSKFKARTAYVYEPAIYNSANPISLPVVILTAGFPGITQDWINSGLQATMDTFAAHHDGITPLVFVVDNTGSITNDTECVNSSRGNVETYLTTDVPNYINANFNVLNGPSHWAIGGLSLGGTCAIMLTLRHPDVYHYFLDYGGEAGPEIGSDANTVQTLFNGSQSAWQQHQPEYLLQKNTYKGLGGFFAVGSDDERKVTDAANTLSAEAQKAGIDTVYETVTGQHTFQVWQDAFRLSLPWVANRTGATECPSGCY